MKGGGLGRLVVAMAVTAGVAACGDDAGQESNGPDPEPAAEASAPYAVETFTETFVDDSRPSEDPRGARSAPTRTLPTDLYVPEGEGPFPLIVHAHGFDGHAAKYSELLTTWAEAGFVVAAPTFPLTNDLADSPGQLDDYRNQPADVAFVIDQVLALADGDHPQLGGRVDGDRIGLSGHSLGGITAYGLVYNDCCRDDRIDALIVMSSLPLEFDGSYAFEGTPLMLMLATGDPIIPHDEASLTYDEAGAPKILVTMDSDEHFEQYEDVSSPHDEVVTETTAAFWAAYLLGDEEATDRLVDAAEADEHTTIVTDL